MADSRTLASAISSSPTKMTEESCVLKKKTQNRGEPMATRLRPEGRAGRGVRCREAGGLRPPHDAHTSRTGGFRPHGRCEEAALVTGEQVERLKAV